MLGGTVPSQSGGNVYPSTQYPQSGPYPTSGYPSQGTIYPTGQYPGQIPSQGSPADSLYQQGLFRYSNLVFF